MRLDNTNEGELAALVERVRKLEAAAPLGFSSITRGALRVASPEGLIVEGSARVSGTLSVTGTENVSGTLNVTGTLNADGTVTLDGDVGVTGPLTVTGTTRFAGDTTQVGAHHVQGNQDITGTLAVKGVATLESDLNVVNSGKVIAGLLRIGPNTGDGGAGITATSGNLSLVTSGAGEVRATYLRVAIALATVDLEASGVVRAQGGITATLPLKSGAATNLHIDSYGKLWRTS